VTAADLNQVVLPAAHGTQIVKMRVGPVLSLGTNSVIALTDSGVLLLLRDAVNAPVLLKISQGVADFAIATRPAGLAHVLTVGAEGLKLGAAVPGGDGTLGARVECFALPLAKGLWADATRIDVAHDDGSLQIVAATSTKLLRGRWSLASERFDERDPLPTGGEIQFLALGDLNPLPGVEVAVGSNALVELYDSLASETLRPPYASYAPLLGSFIDVQRIPFGADQRDSLGLVERGAATDFFRELSSTGMSDPISSAHLRASDVSYGALDLAPGCTSACPQTDMALAMTDGEILILSGHPQAAGGMQFSFDALQLYYLNLAALLHDATLSDLRVSCGDLDGDGDGDLACAARSSGAAKLVVVPNNCAVTANETVEPPTVQLGAPSGPVFSVASGLVGASQLRVALPVSVRKPNSFADAPTHARVRMYTRRYHVEEGPQDPVSPFLWFDRTLLLNCPSPFLPGEACTLQIDTGNQALPVNFQDPSETLSPDETLIYIEITPLLEVSEEQFISALPTNWVGSANPAIVYALRCTNEPDEFSFLCHVHSGAPLINEIHRRKRIRPIGTPPQ